jgi:hypothetical protein
MKLGIYIRHGITHKRFDVEFWFWWMESHENLFNVQCIEVLKNLSPPTVLMSPKWNFTYRYYKELRTKVRRRNFDFGQSSHVIIFLSDLYEQSLKIYLRLQFWRHIHETWYIDTTQTYAQKLGGRFFILFNLVTWEVFLCTWMKCKSEN